jgi:streptomycin 3"-adenylyltransferase
MTDRMKLPKSVEAFIGQIKNDLPPLIPETLFGIYVHGSIAYGDFAEHRSDIDIIAVLKRPLNANELLKLREWFGSPVMQESPWIKKLEMDFPVLATLIADSKYGAPATHFQDGNLDDMENGVDGSNPIAWVGILDCGITLYGPDPKDFVPEITEEKVIRAQKGEFDVLVENYDDWMRRDTWNQVYVITNLCRIAYYLSEKKIASKVAATQWCLDKVPEEYRHLMTFALDHIDNIEFPLSQEVIATLPRFVEYVESLFKAEV